MYMTLFRALLPSFRNAHMPTAGVTSTSTNVYAVLVAPVHVVLRSKW